MISNDERREVSAKLRTLSEDEDSPAKVLYGGTADYDVILCRALRAVVGPGDLFERLADLIDRPTCAMEYEESYSGDEIYPTQA